MKIRNIQFLILIILFYFLSFYNKDVLAHPGRTDAFGCHTCRTNCPSWGLLYGEYHCHNGSYSLDADEDYDFDNDEDYDYSAPIYIPSPPTPTPTPLTLNISTNYHLNEENCTYTISASWNKPILYDRFSVSAVKTVSDKCIDPGPLPDTSETRWDFRGLSSGDYLINVKPGNQFKWDWYYYCAKLHLPKIKPILIASIVEEQGKKYINYSSKCANSIYIDNGVGFVSIKENRIEINPKEKTIYTIKATSGDGETSKTTLEINPNATPTFTITPLPIVDNQSQNTSSLLGYSGASIGGFYLLRWLYQKIKNAKKP